MKPVQHCLQKIIFDPIRESSPLLSNAEATAFAKQRNAATPPPAIPTSRRRVDSLAPGLRRLRPLLEQPVS